jgi:hypothetical protein
MSIPHIDMYQVTHTYPIGDQVMRNHSPQRESGDGCASDRGHRSYERV